MSVGFSERDHADFLKKSKGNWNVRQDNAEVGFQYDLAKAALAPPAPNHKKLNDLRGLVPPLKINKAQEDFLKFWFGRNNAEDIINTREATYTGLLNSQCPSFDDPDATVPYINFATQKLECRRPMPNRKSTNYVNCAEYAQTGPNPFAIESYIKETGESVCRVPVVRGKFYCNELSKDDLNYYGEHMTLPDGTGICVPQMGEVATDATGKPLLLFAQQDAKPVKNYTLFQKFMSDRIIHEPIPSHVYDSPYYNLFTKLRFNYGMVDLAHKAYKLHAANGKHKVIEYLNAIKDPSQGVFHQFVEALHADPKPDALKRYHRDLYFYMKKHYPNYFQTETIPQEDRMQFLGYEGSWVFDNSNVK